MIVVVIIQVFSSAPLGATCFVYAAPNEARTNLTIYSATNMSPLHGLTER